MKMTTKALAVCAAATVMAGTAFLSSAPAEAGWRGGLRAVEAPGPVVTQVQYRRRGIVRRRGAAIGLGIAAGALAAGALAAGAAPAYGYPVYGAPVYAEPVYEEPVYAAPRCRIERRWVFDEYSGVQVRRRVRVCY